MAILHMLGIAFIFSHFQVWLSWYLAFHVFPVCWEFHLKFCHVYWAWYSSAFTTFSSFAQFSHDIWHSLPTFPPLGQAFTPILEVVDKWVFQAKIFQVLSWYSAWHSCVSAISPTLYTGTWGGCTTWQCRGGPVLYTPTSPLHAAFPGPQRLLGYPRPWWSHSAQGSKAPGNTSARNIVFSLFCSNHHYYR